MFQYCKINLLKSIRQHYLPYVYTILIHAYIVSFRREKIETTHFFDFLINTKQHHPITHRLHIAPTRLCFIANVSTAPATTIFYFKINPHPPSTNFYPLSYNLYPSHIFPKFAFLLSTLTFIHLTQFSTEFQPNFAFWTYHITNSDFSIFTHKTTFLKNLQ